ncbi:MAG: SDR family oxidoreductase [Sphingobacteriales bacterium]|nr:MAG: SDR family oxidoreductase [Sphingobacteriales bacterium]
MPDHSKQTQISEPEKAQFQVHLDKPYIADDYKGSGKLKGRTALITGGDSGIGRAVALHYAREGADIAIVYFKSDDDARITADLVENEGRECLLFRGDISNEAFCHKTVDETHEKFGRLDILVNNAGTHEDAPEVADITSDQLKRTFEVNIFSFFYLTQAALKYLKEGSVVINTASITAYRGSGHLLDYSASKGAIVTFTRSLSQNLAERKIRVNGVAPGPVWTPLVVYSFDVERLDKFGKDTPMGRAGYPYELGPAYVFLAAEDSSYITGQMIHVNGGDVING